MIRKLFFYPKLPPSYPPDSSHIPPSCPCGAVKRQEKERNGVGLNSFEGRGTRKMKGNACRGMKGKELRSNGIRPNTMLRNSSHRESTPEGEYEDALIPNKGQRPCPCLPLSLYARQACRRLTSSMRTPKIIREQRCDTLMPFHEHGSSDGLFIPGQRHLYCHNSPGKFDHLVHAHVYIR